MGRGRDAADVPISTAFGTANLVRFEVVTNEIKPKSVAIPMTTTASSGNRAEPERACGVKSPSRFAFASRQSSSNESVSTAPGSRVGAMACLRRPA